MIKLGQLIDAVGVLDLIGAMVIVIGISVFIYNYNQDRNMKTKHKKPIMQRIKQTQDRERKLEDFDQNE